MYWEKQIFYIFVRIYQSPKVNEKVQNENSRLIIISNMLEYQVGMFGISLILLFRSHLKVLF